MLKYHLFAFLALKNLISRPQKRTKLLLFPQQKILKKIAKNQENSAENRIKSPTLSQSKKTNSSLNF